MTAMAIEREIEDEGASEILFLVARGRRINLLLVHERSRRLLFHENLKNGAAAIRTKARLGLPVS